MDLALKQFIEDNINLIEENTYHSWQEVYSNLEDYDGSDLPGDFGKAMLDAGINPCEILGYVPRRFLQFQKDVTNFEIPDNCNYIDMGAFEDTSIEHIEIPLSVIELDHLAFAGSKLKEIILPDSVNAVRNGAFHSCQQLEKVDLGSTDILGEDVFGDCIHLKEVILPSNLKSLDPSVFENCTRLKEIIFLGSIQSFKNIISEYKYPYKTFTIHCNDGDYKWRAKYDYDD